MLRFERSTIEVHILLGSGLPISGFDNVSGVKTLRTHLGQLLGIAQVSKDDQEYEKHVRNVFGSGQQEFDFDL
jgi:hypothetical protein